MKPFLIFLMSACVPQQDYPKVPGQDRATQIVWVESYGQNMGQLPDIEWRIGEYCHGSALPAFEWLEKCYAGLYLPGDQRAVVAWPAGDRIGYSAFAHELMHARQALHGVYDYSHGGPEWAGVSAIDTKLLAEDL